MITLQTISDVLQSWNSETRGECLSVYLETNATTGTWLGKLYELRLNLDKLEKTFDHSEKKDFLATRAKVDSFLKTYSPDSRGLAIFANGTDFWWKAELEVSVASEVRYNHRPYVAPLIRVVDDYQAYCIALVDNANARLLLVRMREIEQQMEIHDRIPKRHKQIEHDPRIERRHAVKVQQHLENAIDALDSMHKMARFGSIILAGAPESLPKFEEALPQHLKKLVAGHFPASVKDGNKEVIEKAQLIEDKIENGSENQIVDELITRSAKNQLAVMGLDSTLIALHHKEVFRLITVPDYPMRGSACSACGFATTVITSNCPVCDSRTLMVDDLLQEAFYLGLLKGVEQIEIVTNQDAHKRLKDAGGVGAFLRIPTNR